jgi:hypothetical protein
MKRKKKKKTKREEINKCVKEEWHRTKKNAEKD